MVMGIHTAYRCKECGEVFFQPRADMPLTLLKKLIGLLTCPHCGSRKVFEDESIKT